MCNKIFDVKFLNDTSICNESVLKCVNLRHIYYAQKIKNKVFKSGNRIFRLPDIWDNSIY